MQRLVFETAWDKQIAPKDRKDITIRFNETKDFSDKGLHTITLKQALNHEEALLVTVLLHNFTQDVITLEDIYATYYEASTVVAKHQVSFPHVILEGKSSMPWTFIFPKSSWQKNPIFQDGKLVIQKDNFFTS